MMDVALPSCWRSQAQGEANDSTLKGPPTIDSYQPRESFNNRWAVDLSKPTKVNIQRQVKAETLLPGHDSRMPATTGSQSLLASLPSFMAVFGDGLGARSGRDENATTTHTSHRHPIPSNRRLSNHSLPPSYIYRRSSSNTFKSESSDSSPTTTISTLDSTLTEPSPSSSPESPTLSLPLSSFSSLKTSSPVSGDSVMSQDSFLASPPPHLASFSRAGSPNKKMRNTKNLSLNTSGSNKHAFGSPLPRLGVSNSTNANHSRAFSAPVSPSFIVPPKAQKRKPSNLGLTITTPETGSTGLPSRTASDIIPQTPSLAHLDTFKHLEGVSSLPLFSPTVAPEGGMQLPPFGAQFITAQHAKNRPALSLSQNASFDSSRSSPIIVQTLEHVAEENDHDLPLSREVKSPAYPEGPVCIYQPGVYLYLEPNDTEASQFDVIINVAREVRNPFDIAAEKAREPQVTDAAVQVNLMPGELSLAKSDSIAEPPSAVSEKSFSSAFEIQPPDSYFMVPDTPRVAKAVPEYIHIPWDHNTNVGNDLPSLCELIDTRVSQGKRVLVHCQCGVSRSASLIVAYGLFKNPELTVQEAYDAVKERSRWIGPNMNLIYQLSEFKSTLSRKFPAAPSNWRSRRNLGLTRTHTDSFLTAHTHPISPISPLLDEPSTAPLQTEQEMMAQRSSSLSPPGSAQHASQPSSGQITPGPSSAPADVQWSPSGPSAGYRRDSGDMDIVLQPAPASRVPPSRMMDLDADDLDTSSTTLQPPPSENSSPPTALAKTTSPLLPGGFSSMSLRRFQPKQLPLRAEHPTLSSSPVKPTHIAIDHIMTDAVPETPSLLSPRAAEFTASPFHRTAAGDLAGSSVFEQGSMSPVTAEKEKDPRSPATRGEAPITRSIDGVL